MAVQTKKSYGSEYHFLRYRREGSEKLDRTILRAIRARRGSAIDWMYPSGSRHTEPQGVDFVENQQLRDCWKTVWPTSGRQQSWDGVAKLGHGLRPC